MNPFFIAGCIGVVIAVVFYILFGVMFAAMVTASGESTDSFKRIIVRWPWYLEIKDENDIPIH